MLNADGGYKLKFVHEPNENHPLPPIVFGELKEISLMDDCKPHTTVVHYKFPCLMFFKFAGHDHAGVLNIIGKTYSVKRI